MKELTKEPTAQVGLPPITVRFLGITEEDGALIEVIIERIDGESTMRKILTAEDTDLEITEDDIVG